MIFYKTVITSFMLFIIPYSARGNPSFTIDPYKKKISASGLSCASITAATGFGLHSLFNRDLSHPYVLGAAFTAALVTCVGAEYTKKITPIKVNQISSSGLWQMGFGTGLVTTSSFFLTRTLQGITHQYCSSIPKFIGSTLKESPLASYSLAGCLVGVCWFARGLHTWDSGRFALVKEKEQNCLAQYNKLKEERDSLSLQQRTHEADLEAQKIRFDATFEAQQMKHAATLQIKKDENEQLKTVILQTQEAQAKVLNASYQLHSENVRLYQQVQEQEKVLQESHQAHNSIIQNAVEQQEQAITAFTHIMSYTANPQSKLFRDSQTGEVYVGIKPLNSQKALLDEQEKKKEFDKRTAKL